MPLVGLLLFLRRCSDWYRSYYVGVSMPLVGLLLFLLELCSTEINRKVDVSMPLVGLLLFLQQRRNSMLKTIFGVNALSRASLISTVCEGSISDNSLSVSMPLVGLLLFLQICQQRRKGNILTCVNALSRDSLISTYL